MFESDPQENVKRDLKHLADDLARLREQMMAGQHERVRQVRDAAYEQFQHARDEVQAKAADVDSYVKEKPWMAVGIAAAAGAVLGLLLSSHKRR